MTELFDEVDEEVRREQLHKLWAQYGNYLIAACVLLVVAVGGWQHSGPGPLVYVFRPSGAVTETHPIPADLPNKCCFGGRDLDLFYVTAAGGCLYQARTAREGLSRR